MALKKRKWLSEVTLRDMVRYYTREAGVRSLEREIAKLCRKSLKSICLIKPHRKRQQYLQRIWKVIWAYIISIWLG